MIPLEWLELAGKRVSPRIVRTPVSFDSELNFYIKWENLQNTGSFKLRGAVNKVLTLEPWERERGLVTASAGNHGQGLGVAAKISGSKAIIFASEHAVPRKIEAMRSLGAEVNLIQGGYAAAERAAINFATENKLTWVSPYNDINVICGQGTLGLELLDQLDMGTIRSVIVPVGGGGLISGIGISIQNLNPKPKLIGIQSEASAFMHALFNCEDQSKVAEWDSLADGLAGAVEEGSITIPLVRSFVDEVFLVTEEEIEAAIVLAWTRYKQVIEGSAAVALAGAMKGTIIDKPAVVIISGGNIQTELHQKLLSRHGVRL